MRRPVAFALAAALTLPALARAAEPLDVDLARLGAPDPAVWGDALGVDPTDEVLQKVLANGAKARFAILSTEMALALSSSLLQPASTTGHSGFDFALEAAYVPVSPKQVVVPDAPALAGYSEGTWPTRGTPPDALLLPSVHVRKALPYSFEVGGRVLYLAQSSYFAGQGEAKWAFNEGIAYWPDLAVRVAWTRLFGQREWNLGTGDVDFMVSKRWGANAVTSFTPYAAARLTYVRASSDAIAFAAADADPATTTSAAFPRFSTWLYRTTVGVRMTAAAVSLAVEGTYFGGAKHAGKDDPGASEYPDVEVDASLGGALRFGFEF